MAAASGPSTSKQDQVDIYSDQEDLERIAEANELFDAVLTGSVNQEKKVTTKVARKEPARKEEKSAKVMNTKGGNSQRRLSLYVGNFPWWTSDKDLINMALAVGVTDITEIKFAENKINGQSRGYAEVVVTSQESLKILLSKIPQCEIHGSQIDCRFATHQNLNMFEDTANKRIPLRANAKDPTESESTDMIPSLLTQEPSTPPLPPVFPQLANSYPLPNPFFSHPPPPFPHMPPPSLFPPPLLHIPNKPSPSLHINPAFFNPAQDGHSSQVHSQQNTNGDFEELMNRNKAVASSAITKAVSGATAGDLREAMETLLTAIAIIKQSRVYSDERCQALVTSLKDCLVSIQGNFGYRSTSHSGDEDRDRDRGRDRGHERDRDRQRNREREKVDSSDWEVSRRRRDRSWSGQRDKEHSRERERHRDHRDRYR